MLEASLLDVYDSSTQYQAFVNVTSKVRRTGTTLARTGTYWVADIQVGTGKSDSTSGGWALVVAYGDSGAPNRKLVVFDGLQNVSGSSAGVTIPLSGFQTPRTGPVVSTAGIVEYEGDLGTTGDGAALQGGSGSFTPLSNAVNPGPPPANASNVFNSTISNAGALVSTRTPSYRNNLGYDADLFRTTGVLGNNQTSTQVQRSTSGDAYQPGVVTLATDLYAPRITPTKTVDRATASLGDTLTYTVALQNTGQDAANNTIFRDPIPAGAVFVPGSIVVNGTPVSDSAGNDVGEFAGGQVVARLGTGATATAGGSLAPNASTTVSFQVTVATAALALGATIANSANISFAAATSGKASTVTTAPATTRVLVPDLAIGKSHDPALSPGQASTYTITVGNIGAGPTSGPVTVTDTIEPPGLTINGGVTGDGWACTITGATVTCTRSDPLAAGSEYPPIAIPVLVSPSAQPGSLSNTASLAAPSDGNPDNSSFTDAGAVSEPAIDLHVEKTVTSTPTVTPAGYIPDEFIEYRIEVTNNGVADAANVQLVDTLEAPIVFLGFGPFGPPGTCNFANPISCDLGTIAPGQPPVVITIVARLPFGPENYPSNRLLDNTATVSAPMGTEMNPDDNSASAAIPTFPAADISLEKTFSPAEPLAGGPITYTVTVRNNGPDMVDTTMDDRLPQACEGFDCRPLFALPPTSVSISGRTGLCEFDPTGETRGYFFPQPIIACDIPQFAPGTERVIRYTSTLALDSAGTQVNNFAAATGLIPYTTVPWDADPFLEQDHFAVTSFTPGSVDVGLAKSVVGSATVAVGDVVTFRLAASNSGTVAATDIVVTDPLPAGLTPVELPPECTAARQTVTCEAGTIAPGGERTFDIRARAEAAAAERTLTNVATVNGPQPDIASANDSAAAEMTVGAFSVLSVSKTASASSVPAGSPVTFTITAQNSGPSAAGTVDLTESLPAGLNLRSITTSRGSCTGTKCSLGDLPAGATAQIVVVADTDANAAGRRLVNSVEVTAATPSSPARAETPVEVKAPATPPLVPAAPATGVLSLTKVAQRQRVGAGSRVGFRIRIANHGAGRRARFGYAIDYRADCSSSPRLALASTAASPAGRPADSRLARTASCACAQAPN